MQVLAHEQVPRRGDHRDFTLGSGTKNQTISPMVKTEKAAKRVFERYPIPAYSGPAIAPPKANPS
jgi:hypothetical protein